MRISVKAAMPGSCTRKAENYSGHDPTTIVSLAKRLGLSKIYLDQVIAQLKRGGVVSSDKGAQAAIFGPAATTISQFIHLVSDGGNLLKQPRTSRAKR
jgi:hypothetical protein